MTGRGRKQSGKGEPTSEQSGQEQAESSAIPAGHVGVSPARARILGQRHDADRIRHRITAAERLLANGMTARQARTALARQEKISARHAARYVSAVHALWKQEADMEPGYKRERNRAEAEATLREIMLRGFAHEAMALDKDGGEHFYKAPDLRAVNTARDSLSKLQGLIGPEKDGGQHVHFHGTPEEARQQMLDEAHAFYFGAKAEPLGLPESIETEGETVTKDEA